jgi:hypothetical protein
MSTLVPLATVPSNLITFLNANFGGNPAQPDLSKQPWFEWFEESFGRWNQLGGVTFTYEPHDDGLLHPSANGVLGVRGDIRIGGFLIDGASNTLAFTYVPTAGSDMAIDTGDAAFFTISANNHVNLRNTLMHEIGHSFGMLHVNSTSNLLMEPVINTSFDGPQLDEVRGVQFIFGDANEKSNDGAGNDSSALATGLGLIPAGSSVTIGAAANVSSQAISAVATDFVSIANLGDDDYYSFTVSQPSLVDATLTPRGGVFTQASEGQTPTTFDANARNNLALAILAGDGTSLLATASNSPAGAAESLAGLELPEAGNYFVRITGTDDTIQLYQLSLTAAALLPGDYNQNGIVDVADYTVWRNTLGLTGTGLAADGLPDHVIDDADYDVWKTHFGEEVGTGSASAGSAQSVPEPDGSRFGLVAFGLLALRRRTGRRAG